MKRIVRYRQIFQRHALMFSLALAVGLLSPAAVTAAQAAPPKVLILNAYHQGEQWSDNELAGILDAFKKSNPFLVPEIEHLDTKRFPAPEHLVLLWNFLKQKYNGRPFDLVMALDNPALDLLIAHRQELFGDVPIVFAGINGYRPEMLAGQTRVAGVVEVSDMSGTLRLALRLHPQARVVFTVHDHTSTGLALRREMEQAAGAFRQQVEFRYTPEGNMPELLHQLGALPTDALVILLAYVTDQNGRTYTREESTRLICDASPVPVYALHETRLGFGIVGGLLLEGRQHGMQAAQLALRVLAGEDADALGVTDSISRPVFDYHQLARFDIPIDRLPAGSVVIHQPVSLWREYRAVLLPGAMVVGFLLVAVAALTISIARIRNAEEKMRRSEERLRHHNQILDGVLAHTHMMAVYLDPAFNFIWVNKAYADTCRHAPDFFPGKNHFDLYPHAENQAIFQTVVDTGQAYFVGAKPFEFPDQPERGVTYWDWSLTPVKDATGPVVGLVFTLAEVTEGVLANRSLQQYKQVVESSQNLVAAVTLDYRYLFVNQTFLKYRQLVRDQVEGKKVEDVLGREMFAIAVKPYLDRCFKGETLRYELELDFPALGRRHLMVTCFPLKDETEASCGAVVIIIDITEIKTIEMEQSKLKQQLNQLQKMEAIGALAGGIAHDFNNILFPIVGFAEMLQEDLPADSPLKECVKEILTGTARARDLVKQILSFSRQADKEIKPLRPHLILEEVVHLIRASLPSTIEIVTDIQTGGRMILADPTQIHQIAMNLVTNAYHAMEEKGGTLSISLKEAQIGAAGGPGTLGPGTYVGITVADTGIGIPGELLEKIFDPYFTTKTKDKGTGLGLAVVHGIVKSYRGEVVVQSAVGKGTSFSVYLPAIAASEAQTEKVRKMVVRGGHERVLLVDDEEQIVRMEKQMLEKLGYQVAVRTSSIEALAAFQAAPQSYDIVITDMTMPKMTGDGLAQELLKIRPELPVIVCTGFSEQLPPERAAAIGIKGYLMKPVVRSDMANLIRQVLDEPGDGRLKTED
jgi:two-component system, cell cycle sensor histidine kinase and response regulator CckA